MKRKQSKAECELDRLQKEREDRHTAMQAYAWFREGQEFLPLIARRDSERNRQLAFLRETLKPYGLALGGWSDGGFGRFSCSFFNGRSMDFDGLECMHSATLAHEAGGRTGGQE